MYPNIQHGLFSNSRSNIKFLPWLTTVLGIRKRLAVGIRRYSSPLDHFASVLQHFGWCRWRVQDSHSCKMLQDYQYETPPINPLWPVFFQGLMFFFWIYVFMLWLGRIFHSKLFDRSTHWCVSRRECGLLGWLLIVMDWIIPPRPNCLVHFSTRYNIYIIYIYI